MLLGKRNLQSKSEVVLRNVVMAFMVIFYGIFLIVTIIIALVGSFHQ